MGNPNSDLIPPFDGPNRPGWPNLPGNQPGPAVPEVIPPLMPNQTSIQQEAVRLYNDAFGREPYPGSTYVPMSQTSQDALAQMEAIARAPNPLLNSAYQTTQQMMQQNGMTPEMQAAMRPLEAVADGQFSVGSQDYYSQLYDRAGQPSAAAQYLSGIASGADGISTPGAFADILAAAGAPTAAEQYLTSTARGDYLSAPNPYLADVLADRSAQIANQVKDAYSGMGRYGSSAFTTDLTDRLGQFQAGVLSENYEAERARQMQAAGMLDAANQQRLAAQYQAALGQTNAEAANIENRMGAARTMDASLAEMLSAQLNAAGGYTNAQATDISNMIGAAGTLSDLYSGGLNRAMQAASSAVGLSEARYAPALRLAQVGMAREADEAGQLADLVARYNFQQRAPLDALAWVNAIQSGQGSFGQTTPPPSVTASPWFNALG